MEGTLSEIRLIPLIGFIPEYWRACNGDLLLITSNYSLFNLIGYQYGGDGVTTFALPTLAAPAGFTYIICVKGNYPTIP